MAAALGAVIVFALLAIVSSVFVWFLFFVLSTLLLRDMAWVERLALGGQYALPFAGFALLSTPLLLFTMGGYPSVGSGTCTLPNGYKLMVTKDTDPGWVFNPVNENSEKSVDWKKDSVSCVDQIQVEGHYILGTRTARWPCPPLRGTDIYFLLDTDTGKVDGFTSEAALREAVSGLGVSVKLERFYDVYRRFDPARLIGRAAVTVAILLALVLLGLVLWWRNRILASRRDAERRFFASLSGVAMDPKKSA